MAIKDKELLDWLDSFPTTEETLRKLDELDVAELDRDPQFVADLLKGMVTEDIVRAMEEEGLNRNQLARKLGKSRQYIGRVLNESANFTLERLAEFACGLGRRITVRMVRQDQALVVEDLPDYGLSDDSFQTFAQQTLTAARDEEVSTSDEVPTHVDYDIKSDFAATSQGKANEKFQLAA